MIKTIFKRHNVKPPVQLQNSLKMKLILALLFFVKFNFAYQIHNKNGFNLTLNFLDEELYKVCRIDRNLHRKNINDKNILDCLKTEFKNTYHYGNSPSHEWQILYCEPPKILDENNDCVSEIDVEKWREVVKNLTGWPIFINLNNVDERSFGKVLRKWIGSEEGYSIFTAIGKTADGEYTKFNLATCYDEMERWNRNDLHNENGDFNMLSIVKILTPQLLSVICFLILLIFYLAIEDLRKAVYGRCWINFLINSLINYLAAVFLFFFIKREDEATMHNLTSPYNNPKNYLKFFRFKASSIIIIFTEFSLYF